MISTITPTVAPVGFGGDSGLMSVNGCTIVLLNMLTRTFRPRHLVRHLYGTEPFTDYCRRRGIEFSQTPGHAMADADAERWRNSVRALPEAKQALVDMELAQVNELADSHSVALLSEAVGGNDLPPDSVAGEAARSLWFFLHHPALFREVLLSQHVAEVGAWRVAQGPTARPVEPMLGRHAALADTLREFFRSFDGSGRYCVVETTPLESSVCFTAHLSDQLELLDVFTEEGQHATRPTRPAVPLLFVYEPPTGRILLKSRLRSRDRIRELVRQFGRAVLDAELAADCLRPQYDLDRLKRPFDPPLDAPDMEAARVKALYFAYPERVARRRVKLETLVDDSHDAIQDLLRDHGGTLDELSVVYAELEVCLRTEGYRKSYVIRLWPDRTSLSQTPLGRRFHACLRRWGITNAL